MNITPDDIYDICTEITFKYSTVPATGYPTVICTVEVCKDVWRTAVMGDSPEDTRKSISEIALKDVLSSVVAFVQSAPDYEHILKLVELNKLGMNESGNVVTAKFGGPIGE